MRDASRLSAEGRVEGRPAFKTMAFLSHLRLQESIPFPKTRLRLFRADMNITIFGIVGQRSVQMPLEKLDVDDLEVGREFMFRGKVYEIRSIAETDDGFLINVILIME